MSQKLVYGKIIQSNGSILCIHIVCSDEHTVCSTFLVKLNHWLKEKKTSGSIFFYLSINTFSIDDTSVWIRPSLQYIC